MTASRPFVEQPSATATVPDHAAAVAEVFPLPLVPFERYMVTDDWPSHPMTIPVVLEFKGELQQEALIVALREALVNHPLLRSYLDMSSGLPPQWVESAEWLPSIDWVQAGG